VQADRVVDEYDRWLERQALAARTVRAIGGGRASWSLTWLLAASLTCSSRSTARMTAALF
jgi:hypothetical protein